MQGTLSRSKFHSKVSRLKGVKKVAVTSEDYLQRAESNLPADELFYHRLVWGEDGKPDVNQPFFLDYFISLFDSDEYRTG